MTRHVSGPTDRVVVVGAGLGGLACAIRLAAAGRTVSVVERAEVPGGRAGRLTLDGFEFDTGPTVLTMPSLIADVLETVDEDLPAWLDLSRLDPAYRAHFADGSTLDVIADTARMAGEVARVCGAREADGYLRFVDYTRNLWHLQRKDFIDRNLDGPRDLLNANLLRLVAAGGFGRLQRRVDSFFRDARTRRIFSFQAMYAGVAPHRALALYAVIAYLDSVAGVYFPRGGIHAVPRALAGVAEKHGVNIQYGSTVDARRGLRRPRDRGGAGGRAAPRRRRRGAQSGPSRRLPRSAAALPAAAAGCATPPRASCCTSDPARDTATSPTTTSTLDGPGARPSTRSSGRAG